MFHFLPSRHPANLSALSRKHIPYKFSKPNRQINTAKPNIVRISRVRLPLNESVKSYFIEFSFQGNLCHIGKINAEKGTNFLCSRLVRSEFLFHLCINEVWLP